MSPSVESVLVSLGVGLVVLAIGLTIKRMPKIVAILLAVGICIIAFVVWPRATLVEVPDLTGLSRDEAVLRLSSLKLVAAPEPHSLLLLGSGLLGLRLWRLRRSAVL